MPSGAITGRDRRGAGLLTFAGSGDGPGDLCGVVTYRPHSGGSSQGVGGPDRPLPPAHVAARADVSGIETTIDFLLHIGGAAHCLPTDPKGQRRVEWVIGCEKTKRPVDVLFNVKYRVSLANEWLAHGLSCQALSVAAMARRLRFPCKLSCWLALIAPLPFERRTT